MIVEGFTSLPSWISFEGAHFELQLIVNGGREARLCYNLDYVSEDSIHYQLWKDSSAWENKFAGGALQGFLYLAEGIYNDSDLCAAIYRAGLFLTKNGLR